MTAINRIPATDNQQKTLGSAQLWEKMSKFLYLLENKPTALGLLARIKKAIHTGYVNKNKPLTAQDKYLIAMQELAFSTDPAERLAMQQTFAELQKANGKEKEQTTETMQSQGTTGALAQRVKALQGTTNPAAFQRTATAMLSSFAQHKTGYLADDIADPQNPAITATLKATIPTKPKRLVLS